MVRNLILACVVVIVTFAFGQSESTCPTADHSDNSRQLQFLKSQLNQQPKVTDPECVLKVMLDLRTQPPSDEAMEVLSGFMEFPRPLSKAEQNGFITHAPTQSYLYPAVGTLVVYGKKATPYLMKSILSSNSELARQNATFALGSVYGGEPDTAIHLLTTSKKNAEPDVQKKIDSALKQLVKEQCIGLAEKCATALKAE